MNLAPIDNKDVRIIPGEHVEGSTGEANHGYRGGI